MRYFFVLIMILISFTSYAQHFFINPNIGYNISGESFKIMLFNTHDEFDFSSYEYKTKKINLSQGLTYSVEIGYKFESQIVTSITYSYFAGNKLSIEDLSGNNEFFYSISSASNLISPNLYYQNQELLLKPLFGIGFPIFKSEITYQYSNNIQDIFYGEWQFGTELFAGIEYQFSDFFSFSIKLNYLNMEFESNKQKHFENGNLKYTRQLNDNPSTYSEFPRYFNISTVGIKFGTVIYL